MRTTKRILSLVLCFAMIVGMLPMFALNAEAADTTQYLFFATDRHENSTIIDSLLDQMSTVGTVEYACLGGDMVNSQNNYSTSTVLSEVSSGRTHLTAENVDIVAGNHDQGANDDASIFNGSSGHLYSGEDYHVYGVVWADVEENSTTAETAAQAFVDWASDLTDNKVIIVMSHMPLHSKRGDNNFAYLWHNALNAVAADENGKIVRDVIFLHGHNHTDERTNYAYSVGQGYNVEGAGTVTNYYTYGTAGYLNANSEATLIAVNDSTVTLTRYNSSGSTGTYATVTRVADSGSGSTGTTTEEKEVYVLVDTMTVGKDYLIANGNTGTVTLLGQSSGSQTTATAEVKTSGDYTYIETADSGYIWNATAHTNSSYSSYPRLINAESYAVYVSSKALAFGDGLSDTSGAIYTRYWTYTDGVMACVSTNSSSTTYYLTYSDSEFAMTSSSTTGIYIYEKQTIEVSSDGTVSGGGDSGDDNTDPTTPTEDDTTGGTEITYGEGTYTTADDGSYQKVTFGSSTTEEKTVYVLTDTMTSGKNYLIVDSNSTSGNALINSSNSVSNTTVTITSGSLTIDGTTSTETYIVLDNSNAVWTAGTSGSNGAFKNGSYYLYHKSGNLSLVTSTNNTNWTWDGSNNYLYYSGGGTKYLVYNDGWDISSTADNVYLYEEVTATVTTGSSVTYSVTASDIEHFLDTDDTTAETATISASLTEGIPAGTYSYTVVSDESGIISGEIASDGTITFSGTTGTAQVKVSYTFTQGEYEYVIWDIITVTATAPYYTLDLHKANVSYVQATAYAEGTTYFVLNEDGTYAKAEGVTAENFSEGTYYTLSYTLGNEITETITIKGIEEGDKYGVWAVVKYFDGTTESGTDMGAVGSAIEWTSSDETVAKVDPVTGIITFTGKEGTVNITATYQVGNKPADTITISVSPNAYTLPADGTTDFPEYPNEGAIRYDKTATAVGNFSETGIAQVELSMTGVPYSTGSEIDVVLVLDASGSMNSTTIPALKEAAYEFVKLICTNEDGTVNNNRVAVVFFGKGVRYTATGYSAISDNLDTTGGISVTTGDSNAYGYTLATVDSVAENSTIYNVIYSGYPTSGSGTSIKGGMSGGTYYSYGLGVAEAILENAKTDGIGNNRQQYCLFLSDGAPTAYTYITNYDTATDSDGDGLKEYSTSSGSGESEGDASTTTAGRYEYYSALMRDAGVSIYGVGCALSKTSYPNSYSFFTKIAGSEDDVYFVTQAEVESGALTDSFKDAAAKILQAATDVIVEDQITDHYTMIFDIPAGTQDIPDSVTNDFYIEFLKYTLDSTTHERVDSDNDGDTYDDATSVTKLYLKNTNGVLSAAKDSTGTAYDAPVFAQSILGDKGTLMFWTTDSSYASKAAVSYNDGTNTYYFIPYGMEANEDGTAPANWYNMTSGAYAHGTIENYGTEESTNMSTDLVIATPYFVYNAQTKMIYWTLDKMQDATTEYALRYFLYLDNSATEVGTNDEVDPGSYLTNDHAYITYTNFKGNDCRQEFPKPQLTWSGAQVSYVFYLVNAAGQPINKSGQVVDFANATFVTDVYTENTVWNKGEDGQITADSKLSIDWLAANLLPTDYKVYDEQASYKLHVYGDHTGESIFDYFVIGGNDAATISSSLNTRLGLTTTESTVSLNTTKVYNTKAGTKVTGYGTYTSEATNSLDNETVLTGFDFYNTTVAFAVVWQPSLAPDTVVVDYGLDVLINVTFNDLMQDNTISGIGLGRDAYGNIAMNTGISTKSELSTAAKTTADGSTISVENDTQIRFSQNDMTFNEPVTFYYESKVEYYENSELKNGYLHTSVTVIPATTIYFEDEYVTLTTHTLDTADSDKDGDTTDYIVTKGWTANSTAASATQAQDRPGTTLISGVVDANNNYGYDAAYSSMSQYSMATAAKMTASAGVEGQATFDFYGTGFDVISMTDTTTGTIVVNVYAYGEDGTLATETTKSYVVDTYYGYKLGDDGKWVTTDANDPNALYQVPVMKISGLDYGKYQAKILVIYDEFFDNMSDGSYDFYLDAIRIYDPTGNQNDDANEAYKADGEGWPTYQEVRDYVITQSAAANLDEFASSGIVFIDGNNANASVENYSSYGPNNELYLAKGQAIAFDLNATAVEGTAVAKIQLAVKSVGDTASIKVYSTDGTVALDADISTATDMYYDITAMNGKTVVITNDGTSGVLSITNVKVTYTEAQPEKSEPTAGTFMLRRSSVDAALATMNVEEEVPETTVPETTVPEETEPETTEPETTVPETSEPETSEPETSEPETSEPETSEPETSEPETEPTEPESDVEEIIEEVKKVIKKIFGWLFR